MQQDATLTRSQKNAVFGWLVSAKFDPTDFEWKEHELEEDTRRGIIHSTASTLFHRPTGYYFNFGRACSKFVPGIRSKVEVEVHLSDWGMRAGSFHLWLNRLRQEVDAPDLLASIGQERGLSTAASSAGIDNRPFNAAEQKLIGTNWTKSRTI